MSVYMDPLPKVDEIHTVIVYDTETGEIAHAHQLVIFEGADPSCKRNVEDEALAQARAAATTPRKISALNIATRRLDPERTYLVDPERRVLLERSGRVWTSPEEWDGGSDGSASA